MAKVIKPNTTGQSRIRLGPRFHTATENSLFLIRMRELDREFARQTKQLTKLSKRLTTKIGERIIPTKKQ
jgi:hypothetical protein